MPTVSLLRKRALVAEARRALAAGESLSSCAIRLSVPKGTLHKWLNAASLRPDYSRCGRPQKYRLNDAELAVLRGLTLKHGSAAFAIETFPHQPECTAETRALILAELDKAAQEQRRPRWPESLRNQILPNGEDQALFRGPKAFDNLSHAPRKGMFFEDESGAKIPILARDVWTMDDYSTNQPYIIETPEGPRLCRQVLAAMDVYSAGWLSVEMIGRERDAYRAEDIVRFILRTIEAQGTMPLALMLERGRWDSQAIHGVDLSDLGTAFVGQTWGALDDLFAIVHGYSSRHKAVLESSFDMLQTVLAHSGRDIGRFRGEFEGATKSYLAVQAGRKDPRACGFLSQDEARRAHWDAMQIMNTRSRQRSASEFEGRALVPNDLLSQDAGEIRPLPVEERWRFSPIKRLATIRGGHVETSVTHYGASFRFEVNGVSSLYLPEGHRVLIAFDPALPAGGCHIANAEPRNRDGWPVGQILTLAPHAQDAPQFRLHGRREGTSGKAKANAAARTAFAGVNPHKLGMTHTQAHNGQGGAAIVRTGAPATAPAQPPAPTTQAPRGVAVMGLSRGSSEAPANPARGNGEVESLAEARRRALDAAEEAAAI